MAVITSNEDPAFVLNCFDLPFFFFVVKMPFGLIMLSKVSVC